jgi:serine/threonine-protein kinase
MQPGHLHPARLPLGTRVGDWRVLERRGLGAYGAVYRAFRAEDSSGPVALKLALHSGDERFAREQELLSRIRHPSVPRLVDHGSWGPPEGPCHPYLAMEWVEGVSLYRWAYEHRPTSRQVLRVLASLARALEATHASACVHRDVKGDNVLVREADGHAFLTDFGSGHFQGAARLTWHPFPPGTPAYRSPEAWRSAQLPSQQPTTPYAPGPADDVFALGVTAYRLITDEYPAGEDPTALLGKLERFGPPSARVLNARCCEDLDALTSRMLCLRPEARGSAREVAEALEQAALEAGPEADVALFAPEAPEPTAARPVLTRPAPPASVRASRSWRMATSMGLGGALAMGAVWMLSAHPGEQTEEAHASTPEEARDGGTVALGDSALTAPVSRSQPPSAWSAISVDLPPRPLPGQRRPDATGRCPRRSEVLINGGCWKRLAVDLKDCDKDDFVYKGACYSPAFPPERPPTSSPAEPPDASE